MSSANSVLVPHISADEIVAVLFMYTTLDKSVDELAAMFNRTPQHIADCLDLRSNTRIIVEYVPPASRICGQCHTANTDNTAYTARGHIKHAELPPTGPDSATLARRQYKKLKHILHRTKPETCAASVLYYTCVVGTLVNVPLLLALLYMVVWM